jgi:hypothetical protein
MLMPNIAAAAIAKYFDDKPMDRPPDDGSGFYGIDGQKWRL